MKHPVINGLYAITPDQSDTTVLLEMTRCVLAGGVRLVQYRNKTADKVLLYEQACLLRRLCQEYKVPLIINDYVDLAIEIGADGVHIGASDISIAEARLRLGQEKIIGASCYNQLDLAIQAEKQDANYVAFGAFFTSFTKPDATEVSVELIYQARQQLSIPIVAIGGINLTNVAILINHGCHAIAVSNALFHTQDNRSTAKQFSQLFC